MSFKSKVALPRFLMLFAWMTVIFWFSADSGDDSSGKSYLLVAFLRSVGVGGDAELLSFILRKAAHFFVYLLLGIFAYRVSELYFSARRAIALALVIVFLYAVSDEVHQLFVPGRSGQVVDVLIDTLGGVVGVLLWITFQNVLRARGRRQG